MAILMENGLLQAAEQKIESALTPENRVDYMKIVVAGMKTALYKGPNGGLASLTKSKAPIQQCVSGAINLCMMMKQHATGTMPVKALVPAAMTLMLKGLDFLDKTGTVKVGGTITGDNPKTSVVNRYLQAWEADNLFVMGASVFPQNASYNPTGLVGALAYYAAEAITTRYIKNPGPLVNA